MSYTISGTIPSNFNIINYVTISTTSNASVLLAVFGLSAVSNV